MTLVKFITPINLKSEKEKFFKSATYNPIFSYDWSEKETNNIRPKNPKYKDLIESILKQDHDLIYQTASRCFSTEINDLLLKKAKTILIKNHQKNKEVPINNIVSAFQKAFSFLNLVEYKIEISDSFGFNFRPSPKNKKIVVSKHLNLDYFSIDGEVKHELTHIIRSENGQFNNILPSQDYLPTEEGLATFFQDYHGHEGEKSLFQHAAEYAMTEVSLCSSLREVYEFLRSIGFSPELAWQRSIRHKFGFIDTSKPGDIMKPSMYFYHQQKIKALSESERFRLMIGKISLNEISNFSIYKGRIPLKLLSDFYNNFFNK